MLRLKADIRGIPDVGGYPNYYVMVTAPFTTGLRETEESEPKGQPHEDRAIRAAEKEKGKRLQIATRHTYHTHRTVGLRRVRKMGRES